MHIDREKKAELRALSLQSFGSPNTWYKILQKGYPDYQVQIVNNVPQPVLDLYGNKILIMRYPNLEQLTQLMLDIKAKREEAFAAQEPKAQIRSDV